MNVVYCVIDVKTSACFTFAPCSKRLCVCASFSHRGAPRPFLTTTGWSERAHVQSAAAFSAALATVHQWMPNAAGAR